MHTKPLDATIYSVQASFRLTPDLQLEQQYPPGQPTMVDSMTSASQFGRQAC